VKSKMTVIFSDNFETDVVWTKKVTTSGEKIAVVTISGNKAAQFSTDGVETGEMCYLQENLSQLYSEIFVREYIYYDDIPPAGKSSYPLDIRNHEASGGAVAAVQLIGNRLYLLYDDTINPTGKSIDTGINIVANKWYCIEIHAKVGTTDGLVQLYVNGEKVAEVLNINNLTTVGPVQIIQVGERWFNGQVPHALLVDEVVASTEYIGPLPQPSQPQPTKIPLWKIGAAVAAIISVGGAAYALSRK
jgi:hypothetical protein